MSNLPTSLDRAMASQRALERGELSELPVSGIYEYTVVTATPAGISATPTLSGMPPIQNASAEGIGPTTLLALIGQRVLVAFINQDRSRPVILSTKIVSSMLLDSTVTAPSGPVSLTLPLVSPLVSP